MNPHKPQHSLYYLSIEIKELNQRNNMKDFIFKNEKQIQEVNFRIYERRLEYKRSVKAKIIIKYLLKTKCNLDWESLVNALLRYMDLQETESVESKKSFSSVLWLGAEKHEASYRIL